MRSIRDDFRLHVRFCPTIYDTIPGIYPECVWYILNCWSYDQFEYLLDVRNLFVIITLRLFIWNIRCVRDAEVASSNLVSLRLHTQKSSCHCRESDW